MKKSAVTSKLYFKIRSRNELKKRYRNASFRRKRIHQHFKGPIEIKQHYQPKRPRIKRLIAPEEFNLFKRPNAVLEYIRSIKKMASKDKFYDHILLDLSDVKDIDSGAISMLLSAAYHISIFNFSIGGNYPNDPICKKFFKDSGFLSHMKYVSDSNNKPNQNSDMFVKKGKDTASGPRLGATIKRAMKILTGESKHYPPIYTMLLEMAGNSVEHAYEENKHWLLSMQYDEYNNKIIFTFADNGFGILKTIRRKFHQEIKDLLITKDDDVLRRAFQRKYGSRTREINRNTGLPSIEKVQIDGKVDNLVIITDNVVLDFGRNSSKLLKSRFSGTFYYWELTLKNLKNEKDIFNH
ncbi:hypothetical protein [Draconibacterium mangrovi]|uniref:hypothetical protein n=1 Tax=Draconibacterium mangrovi TaxID=2697469 RepID=UPI0013D61613|nr:hypothetical protein [Draconibacterium mangrovi]